MTEAPGEQRTPGETRPPGPEGPALVVGSTARGGVGKTPTNVQLGLVSRRGLLADLDPAHDPAGAGVEPATTRGYELPLVDPADIGRAVIAPFSVGYAARTLGLNKRQMEKLIGCGLLRVDATTERGHRRVRVADVVALATRPAVGTPAPGDLAVHLGPLADEPEPTHQRSHVGWHADAAAMGLSAGDVEDAWAGLWRVDPEPHVGAALVGNVAGFVVELGVITDFRHIAGRVRFLIDAPTPEISARYAGRRFRARPGDMVQRLGAETALHAAGAQDAPPGPGRTSS